VLVLKKNLHKPGHPAVYCPWIPWEVAWKEFPWSIGTEFHGKK